MGAELVRCMHAGVDATRHNIHYTIATDKFSSGLALQNTIIGTPSNLAILAAPQVLQSLNLAFNGWVHPGRSPGWWWWWGGDLLVAVRVLRCRHGKMV